jgi:hypothetical protein
VAISNGREFWQEDLLSYQDKNQRAGLIDHTLEKDKPTIVHWMKYLKTKKIKNHDHAKTDPGHQRCRQ